MHPRPCKTGTAFVLAMMLILAATGCQQKKTESAKSGSATTTMSQSDSRYQTDSTVIDPLALPVAEGGTMSSIFGSTSLFTCDTHPEIITTVPGASCPQCGTPLVGLSSLHYEPFMTGSPKGCPMHPVVVPEESGREKCPICNMKLEKIVREG